MYPLDDPDFAPCLKEIIMLAKTMVKTRNDEMTIIIVARLMDLYLRKMKHLENKSKVEQKLK